MPVLNPTIPVFFLRDLQPEVVRKMENDTSLDASNDIYRWLRDALVEIANNADYMESFDQLEVYGPTFNLTVNQQEYFFGNIVNEGDYNLETLDIVIWIDYPTNMVRKKLRRTDFQETDKFQQYQSLPVYWYRFGDNVGFQPQPNQPYQVQARIMRAHPINDVVIGDTQILLPREWNEVIEWAACMRGYMERLQYEKAGEIRTMLYGDPKNPGKIGLIESIKKRRRREAWLEEQPLRPVIRGYGWGTS